MAAITRHLVITGRVQGVGYRFYMERRAREFGVAGWVRNRRDGSVEALVHGEPAAVEAIIGWSRRGPSSAVVAEVRIDDGSGEFSEFKVLPTE